MPDPTGGDASMLAKWAGAVATFFAGGVAMLGLGKKVMDGKADKSELEVVKEQQDRHHKAIIELYRKNDDVLELVNSLDRKGTERHIELLNAIHKARG